MIPEIASWHGGDLVDHQEAALGSVLGCWVAAGGVMLTSAVSWPLFSYAFGVGMVATVNPCGAAMLPAYLAWFTRPENASPAVRVLRAVLAGTAVTAGFIAVFGVVGGMVSAGLSAVMTTTPYVGIVVGLALVVVGALTVVGRHVGLWVPGAGRSLGGRGRGLGAMVGFGVSYGLASLGCALPVFLAGVTVAFTRHGLVSGVGAFVAYALGMGVVLTGLALVFAVAPQARLGSLRAASGRLRRPAGALLMLVGGYVVYYWVVGGVLSSQSGSELISVVDGLSARLEGIMSARLGAGLGFLVVLAVTVAVTFGRRRSRHDRLGADSRPTGFDTPGGASPARPGSATDLGRVDTGRWPS